MLRESPVRSLTCRIRNSVVLPCCTFICHAPRLRRKVRARPDSAVCCGSRQGQRPFGFAKALGEEYQARRFQTIIVVRFGLHFSRRNDSRPRLGGTKLIPSLSSVTGRMTSGERRFAQRLESHLEDDWLCWYDVPVTS